MRKILVFALISLFLFSFSLQRKKKLIPPGTVQITETFFVDETEISNLSWREYCWWTKRKYGSDSKEYYATLPDTSVWLEKGRYNEPYCSVYFWHPAFKDYPVVGISYEQAAAFCKWRTERVQEFVRIAYKKEWDIEYRLPTRDEWEKFSFTYVMTPNFKTGRDTKDRAMMNCLSLSPDTIGSNGSGRDNADVTAPVFSYKPNAFKIYNSFGNVAEMISENGVCKGGSWVHQPEDCRPGKDIPYTKPTAWLGFRCVCVMNNEVAK